MTGQLPRLVRIGRPARVTVVALALLGVPVAAWCQPSGPPAPAAAAEQSAAAEESAAAVEPRTAGDATPLAREEPEARDEAKPVRTRRRAGRGDERKTRNERLTWEAPSDDEWREAAASMRDLTPNAWERFQEIPRDSPFLPAVRRRIVDRYQDLARLKERHPEQHAAEVEQMGIEDEILGIAAQLRGAGPEAAEALKQELRERVGRLVDLRMRNREKRIDRLARSLETERKKLEADRQKQEQTVQKRYESIVKGSLRGGGIFGNSGGRGAAGGGRGGRGEGGGGGGPSREPRASQPAPGAEVPVTPADRDRLAAPAPR